MTRNVNDIIGTLPPDRRRGIEERAAAIRTTFSRRPKESHRDTIAYEIEMLNFSAETLLNAKDLPMRDEHVYLETFLLHYRNIIRVFSGENHRGDDLSTERPEIWAARELTPEEIASIRDPAVRLDQEYFTVISKYLQHCTELRSDNDRSWNVKHMADEIAPIITAFERAFPN